MVQEVSLCELVYRAKWIVRASDPPCRVRLGDTHTHRVADSWSAFTTTGKIVPEIHRGQLMSFTAFEKVLFEVYEVEGLLGGRSEISWAWRSSLYVCYCEPCETLFWLHQLPDRMPLWPATYHPSHEIYVRLATLFPPEFLG